MEVKDAEIVSFTPKYKYIHMRYHDANGKVLNLGGVTIAYQVDGKAIKFGIACCSLEDNFDRSLGRGIARQRIHNGSGGEIPIIEGRDTRDIIEDLIVPLAYEQCRTIRGRYKTKQRATKRYQSVNVVVTNDLY